MDPDTSEIANMATGDTFDEDDALLIYDEPPLYQPMRYSREVADIMDWDSAHTIRTWVVMRTFSSPKTGIGFRTLYNIYVSDFRQFQNRHPLLNTDDFMVLVDQATLAITWHDIGGVMIIKGLKWATGEDLLRPGLYWFDTVDPASVPLPKELQSSRPGTPFFEDDTNQLLDSDLYDVSKIDADGKYQAWIKDCLVVAPQCRLDVGDLWLAFKAKFADPDETDLTKGPMTIKQLLRLVAECFSHAEFKEYGKEYAKQQCMEYDKKPGKEKVFGIEHVRWKELPERYIRSVSVHSIREGFPEQLKEEAHKLLYLSKKRRAKAWLFMCFERSQGCTTSLRSMWKFYAIAFARSADTHELLDQDKFLEVLKKTFKWTEVVRVSENHSVVLDLGPKMELTSAEEYMALKRYYDFMRLESVEPTDPRNRFNEKLMEDPMLAQPPRRYSFEYPNQNSHNKLKIFDGSAAPGPFIQRLRRRAHDPPLPLGDEEPGFPGVSMKLEQKRYKRKIEAWKQASAGLFDPDPAKRPTTAEWAKTSRAAASVTPIFKIDSKPPNVPSYGRGSTTNPSSVPLPPSPPHPANVLLPPSPPPAGAPGGVKSYVTADQAAELIQSGCKVEFRKRTK